MKDLVLDEPFWMTKVAATVWRKLRRSVKRRGVIGTAGYITLAGPTRLARQLGFSESSKPPSVASVFDSEHGVDTAGHIPLNQLGVDSENLHEANHYGPTSPKYFMEMMQHLTIRYEDYAFVDIGCGKGLVLLLASAYPFRRIMGVEFSADLIAVANKNLEAYDNSSQACRDIQCLCMDATQFQFPAEPLVIYFYNSFKGKVLRQFAANVARTIIDHPREVYLVYNNPTEPDAFDVIPTLERVVDDPDYLIYRTTPKGAGRQ